MDGVTESPRRAGWHRPAVIAALMPAAFTFDTAENLPVGLLELIAESLRVSVPALGLLVTGYGVTVAVVSVPLAHVVRGGPRRHVLTALLAALVESWRSAVHRGTTAEAGWPLWLNVPSKVAQVAAVRAVAAERREHDLATGTLVASVCPGMVDTATSRPWFSDFSQAQSPAQAARSVLDLIFADHVDPTHYGELVRFGKSLDWYGGTPPVEQDRLVTP